jgi:nucleotide-binding universal stress UspA family protein
MNTIRDSNPFFIVLGVDGSHHSEAAVQMIATLPVPEENLIHAIAVLPPRQLETHTSLQVALLEAQKQLEATGWVVETELITGYPAKSLIDTADEKKASLIVVGAVGLRATLGILLGGVAQQVIEYGKWPVLTVRAPSASFEKLLLATDGSDYSHTTIEYLSTFPLPSSTQVVVAHVLSPILPLSTQTAALMTSVDPLPVVPPMPDISEIQKWQDEEEQKGNELLQKSVNILLSSGIKAEGKLLRGDAATEIIKFARESDVNLIVAGSRGYNNIAGWLLGSVSRKLVHYASCSVLIVRKP